jgi:hypothetical protein
MSPLRIQHPTPFQHQTGQNPLQKLLSLAALDRKTLITQQAHKGRRKKKAPAARPGLEFIR